MYIKHARLIKKRPGCLPPPAPHAKNAQPVRAVPGRRLHLAARDQWRFCHGWRAGDDAAAAAQSLETQTAPPTAAYSRTTPSPHHRGFFSTVPYSHSRAVEPLPPDTTTTALEMKCRTVSYSSANDTNTVVLPGTVQTFRHFFRYNNSKQ